MSFLFELAASAVAALLQSRGGHTVHAVPPGDVEAFMAANPGAVRAGWLVGRLEAAGEYEAADAIQLAAVRCEQAGCVAVCT